MKDNYMKFFQKGFDGGDQSNVTGYWLIEIKSLFSIVLLRFGKGSREAYHTHAFNAFTWFLKGEVDEIHKDGQTINWKPSLKPKFTPRNCYHKVFAKQTTWALSFRGPWVDKWKEYRENNEKEVTLTHGRRVVDN